MIFPEDFFRWLVIFFVRPQRQKVSLFVSRLFKQEKIGKALTRIALAVALSMLPAGLSSADQPREQDFNIPQQSVQTALDSLATQANVFLLFPFDQVIAIDANAVQGTYSIQQALDILLQNTGLTGDLTEGGVIAISQTGEIASATENNGKGKRMNTNKRKNLLATFVALFAAGATTQGAMAQTESETAQSKIDEIIVTATRRAESLNDTAISIAAIGGEEIARRNLSEMNDYLRTVPGVNFIELGAGSNAVITRGIGISPQLEGDTSSPTTGIYFGEVPLAGLGALGGSSDLKMIDLERVEVLRGPQGTLFGSGALAGAVRYIPNPPSLNELEGNLKTSYSNTEKKGAGNTKVEGMVNIPIIEDMLALRAVAYRHDTSGYINNVAGTTLANNGTVFPGLAATDAVTAFGGAELYQNEKDLGNVTHTGGRISTLWRPTEALSVVLRHVYQEAKQQGQPYVELTTGRDYEQITLQFGDGEGVAGEESGHKNETNITSLDMEYDLGWVNLLSSSSWISQDGGRNRDESAFGGFPAPQLVLSAADVFSEELRLTSQLDGPFQYVAGAYYEEIETNTSVMTWASTDELQTFFGSPFGSSRLLDITLQDKDTDQLAFFGELSYDINERLEVTLGARRFDYKRFVHNVGEGILGNFDIPREVEESGTNFKANLSYKPNEETLIYTQWAEGFRLGSTVFPPPPACDANNDGILDGANVPILDGFDADNTENFELGAKFTLLNNRLRVNGAIYRIKWQDIPVFVQGVCGAGVTANAGESRSQGFELETIYQFNQNLRVSLEGAYTNAKLTEDAPGIGGKNGDRLPSSPEYSINLGLQYEFELGGYASYVGGDYAYVGEFFNGLAETGVKLGDYGQLNMSAGVTFNSLNIEFFGHNLTDENALTYADIVVFDDRAYQLKPRTIGLNVGYRF